MILVHFTNTGNPAYQPKTSKFNIPQNNSTFFYRVLRRKCSHVKNKAFVIVLYDLTIYCNYH